MHTKVILFANPFKQKNLVKSTDLLLNGQKAFELSQEELLIQLGEHFRTLILLIARNLAKTYYLILMVILIMVLQREGSDLLWAILALMDMLWVGQQDGSQQMLKQHFQLLAQLQYFELNFKLESLPLREQHLIQEIQVIISLLLSK